MIGKVDPSSSDDFSVDSILDIVLDLPVGIIDVQLVIVGLVAVCFVIVGLVAVCFVVVSLVAVCFVDDKLVAVDLETA